MFSNVHKDMLCWYRCTYNGSYIQLCLTVNSTQAELRGTWPYALFKWNTKNKDKHWKEDFYPYTCARNVVLIQVKSSEGVATKEYALDIGKKTTQFARQILS